MENSQEQNQFLFNKWIIIIPVYVVLILWVIFFIQVKFDIYLVKYGLYPRTLSGLKGLVFSPFIHGSLKHLFNNSIPLLILMISLFYFYRKIAFKILVLGGLFSGLMTWIIARDAYHIGASGIVYLLFSFILFSGIIRAYNRLIALSLIVIFLYGSMIWYILPIKEEISWEGHLSGFLVGLALALIYRKHGPKKIEYDWQDDQYEDIYYDSLDQEETDKGLD